MRIYTCLITICIFLLFLSGISFTEPASEPFRLGESEGSVEIWWGGVQPQKVFFYEFLPALFERTLIFDEFELDGGTFEWIFTGSLGGFTVSIDDSTVRVSQRFYDSHGLRSPESFFDIDPSVPLKSWFDKTKAMSSYPQKTWFRSTEPRSEPVKSVTVILDHKISLRVLVNGKLKLHQTCILDVHRHQLRINKESGIITGRLVKPEPVSATITIDTSEKHQTMVGWGGTTITTAYRQLSPEGKKRWWELVCEYNLLVQRENPIGSNLKENMSNWDDIRCAIPSYYGDAFPNFTISDFNYNRILQSIGGQVWFEFWGSPRWAYEDYEWTYYDRRKVTKAINVEKWTKAVIGYCRTAKKKAGKPPDIIGIQNEGGQPVEKFHAMTLALRKALDDEGFAPVRIHMSNANMLTSESAWGKQYSNGIGRAREFKSSKEVWDTLDYSATNMYDYQQFFNRPDDYDKYLRDFKNVNGDKPFLSVELCINHGRYQHPSYRLALMMGQLYHKNITIADAVSILYCYSLVNVNQQSFGWTRSLFVPDREHSFMPKPSSNQLRVFGAYSRRIKEGMVRVEAGTDSKDLFSSAFIGTKDKKTVVIFNRSTVPQNVRIKGFKRNFKFMEVVDPYNENVVLDSSKLAGVNTPEVTVAPGAIVTLSTVPLGKLPRGFFIEE